MLINRVLRLKGNVMGIAKLFRTMVRASLPACVLACLASTAFAAGPVPTPEIDPASISSAIALLVGSAMLLTGKRRKQ
jgi:hypothetical protein